MGCEDIQLIFYLSIYLFSMGKRERKGYCTYKVVRVPRRGEGIWYHPDVPHPSCDISVDIIKIACRGEKGVTNKKIYVV